MASSPVVARVANKLARAEIPGINPHTLAVAVSRAEVERITFEPTVERHIAAALLDRIAYPESVAEMNTFLATPVPLSATTLLAEEITDLHAPHYMRWVAGFLNDPDQHTHKNARLLLRWLVANRGAAIHADQPALDNLRQVADEPASVWRSSAYIVYGLGSCGVLEDYDRVIFHAEKVIEHDRDSLEMVAEALYRLHPPALISAVQYFLDTTTAPSKQFTAGLHLLGRVAEIDDREFWRTYYDDMDQIVARLGDVSDALPAVERLVDSMEKHLALAFAEDES